MRLTMGNAGRVVGNLIRAGTCRLGGAARDNVPVCSVATGGPVSAPILRSHWPDRCFEARRIEANLAKLAGVVANQMTFRAPRSHKENLSSFIAPLLWLCSATRSPREIPLQNPRACDADHSALQSLSGHSSAQPLSAEWCIFIGPFVVISAHALLPSSLPATLVD